MKTRIAAGCVGCLLVIVGMAIAQGLSPSAGAGDFDFGTKMLGVTTAVRGDGISGTYLTKAKIRRIADQYFLVGQNTETGSTFKTSNSNSVFIPFSVIVRIQEFENADAVKQAVEDIKKAGK